MEWLVAEFAATMVRVVAAIAIAYGVYRYTLSRPRRLIWLALLPAGIALSLLGGELGEWLMEVMRVG